MASFGSHAARLGKASTARGGWRRKRLNPSFSPSGLIFTVPGLGFSPSWQPPLPRLYRIAELDNRRGPANSHENVWAPSSARASPALEATRRFPSLEPGAPADRYLEANEGGPSTGGRLRSPDTSL